MNWYQRWIIYKTIVVKEIKRTFRVWSQTLLPPMITSALYFMIFGHIIGQRVGTIDGYSYTQYIAPGLIMLFIINTSYSATISSFFIAKFQRSIEELLVAPVSEALLVLGYVSGGIVRGFLVGILVFIVAFFFTHLHMHELWVVLLVGLMSSSLFSLVGIINGIFAKKFDDIAIIPTFVLTPMTYLGGVFYSLKMLPHYAYYISLFNPIVYIVEAFRYGFLGVAHHYYIEALLLILMINVGLFLIAWSLLKKGVGLRA